MKNRILLLTVVLALILSGCSVFRGSYVNVTPHKLPSASGQSDEIKASNYPELREAMEKQVQSGRESVVVIMTDYDPDQIESGLENVRRYLRTTYPLGAYAVDDLSYEIGMNGGRTAVAVTLTYRHSALEIQKIRHIDNMQASRDVILQTLENCDPGVVMLIDRYYSVDYLQLITDLAQENPQIVMEVPHVSEGVYGVGSSRVVELNFTYENSRESLRRMQVQVRTMFDSAAYYVSNEDDDYRKLSQLYVFLMERFDYQLDSSITPAYSLLRHGVGDSRAFAVVYSAMCRRSDLECLVVTGTRQGEPWTWNIVRDGEKYYHVDLLACLELGGYWEKADNEMLGYVWDYSAFPACVRDYPSVTSAPSSGNPEPAEKPTEPAVEEEPEETVETQPETEPEEIEENEEI